MPIYILCDTSIGVLPLPLETVLLDEAAQENLNQALKDSKKYLEEKYKDDEVDIVAQLQEATKRFIFKLKHKDKPVLLLPK